MSQLSELLVTGATVIFKPDPAWDWEGWNGEMKVEGSTHWEVDGKRVVVEPDLKALGQKLAGKSYKAKGFDDTPGSVTQAQVTVDGGTLSDVLTVADKKAATKATRGKFTVSCVPSMKSGSPPVPDPSPVKQGTWEVGKPGQSRARAS